PPDAKGGRRRAGLRLAHAICRRRTSPADWDVLTNQASEQHTLYRWQLDALVSWLRCGRRGVIEAVTGSGKTDVAIAAAADALRRGRFVLVVVPSRVLMEQWHRRLTAALPEARIGRLGDSDKDL